MKKGFTLIELLAVIVILAIIALIATPIVIGIIKDAKDESSMRSVEMYLEGVKLSVAKENFKRELVDTVCVIQSDGNLECDGETVPVEVSNQKATGGTIVIENGAITNISNLQMGEKYYNKDENTQLVASDTAQEPKFTGTIYRDGFLGSSSGYIGRSISDPVNVWCIVAGDYDLCEETTYYMSNTKEECEAIVAYARTSDSIDPEMQALAQIAECKEENRIAFPSYTTDPSELTWGVAYLKHNVVNGIVTTGSLCVKYDISGEEKTVCLKGADPSAYADENTGNVAILKGLQEEGITCSFGESESSCDVSWGPLTAKANGDVHYSVCHVYATGETYCD